MKKCNPITVMGFGTFDGLHPGHLYFLRQLKSLGDEVFVVIARSRNVKKNKGKNPDFSEKERLESIKKTGLADRVLMGHPTDFYHLLNTFQPDVIGLGYDQKADIDLISKKFPNLKIIRLKPFKADKYKSSIIKAKV